MKILILPVTYNSYDSLKNYLDSVEKSYQYIKGRNKTIVLTVYIVDNSTLVQDIDMSIYSYSIKIFKFNNLGYLGGAQAVLSQINNLNEFTYVMITNVDVTLDVSFFLCLSNLETDTNTAWIAPSIYSTLEKRDRNPQRINRCSKIKIKLLYFMFAIPILQIIYKKYFYKKRKNVEQINKANNREIYCGHGSVIVLTNNFFNICKKLDFRSFLYCEELYLGELILQNRMKVLYVPELKIIDNEHVSTSLLPSKMYFKYNKDSLRYIYKEFY